MKLINLIFLFLCISHSAFATILFLDINDNEKEKKTDNQIKPYWIGIAHTFANIEFIGEVAWLNEKGFERMRKSRIQRKIVGKEICH